jgi:ATP-dependent Zn protease
MHLIIVGLAGRAAEELFFETPCIYSGGGRESDLGRVTRLAYLLETSFGFGKDHKLVYREQPDFVTGLTSEPGLLERVNRRLEMSFRAAFHLLALHRGAVEYLANELMRADTLDGDPLKEVLKKVRALMERDLSPA